MFWKQRLVALEESGRSFKISKWEPTTKLCPVCGAKNDIPLSERTYRCPCGYVMERDTHSARNVLMIGTVLRAGCLEQAPPELGPIHAGGLSDCMQDPVLMARQEAAALYGRR